MAVRPAKLVDLVSPMDVDEAAARIDDLSVHARAVVVTRFQSIQPEDARGDKVILRRRPFGGQFAGRLSGLEDHARHGFGPDLLADLMEPDGGLMRIQDASTASPGRADDIGFALVTTEMP